MSEADDDALQRYLNGELPAVNAEALEKRLLEEPLLAERLLSLARDEAVLREWALGLQASHSKEATAGLHGAVLRGAAPVPRAAGRWNWKWRFAAAATVIVVCTAAFILRTNQRDVVARITHGAQGASILRSGAGVSVADGQELLCGDELRVQDGGMVSVDYSDGTHVELGGRNDRGWDGADSHAESSAVFEPAEHRASGKTVRLRAGVLFASVAKQPAGSPMLISAEYAEAEVLGTRLILIANKADTRLTVDEGAVSFRRTDSETVVVRGGYVAVAARGVALEALPVEKKSMTANADSTQPHPTDKPETSIPPAPPALAVALSGWEFDMGPEFPGATGSLNLEPHASRNAQECLKLVGDFTKGGKYVQTGKRIPPVEISELAMWARSADSDRLTIRVLDASGQTHQWRIKMQTTDDWQRVVLPLEYFFAHPADARAVPAISNYEHWDGAKDGAWHGPATAIYFILPYAEKKKVQTILFSDVSILPRAPPLKDGTKRKDGDSH